MNKYILNTGVQKVISDNLNTDIVSFLLKRPFFDTVSQRELAEQLESKKKSKKKLPIWYGTPFIYYPKKINIEQTSSEVTAEYKSKIVSGEALVDLTGGFGVDSYFFSQKMSSVFHCEMDSDLAEIGSHNFKILEVENIQIVHGDGLQFLRNSKSRFDWLYLDPSRRNNKKGKVFHLSDCLPDVTEHLDLLFSSSDKILIKTAPFLDISSGIRDLKNIRQIHVVAVDGEVKELLWLLEKEYSGEIQVKTININKDASQVFDFSINDEKEANSTYGPPRKYLYEPNAAILKSGAFKTIGNRFVLEKLHQHTHLYTSKELIDFPGRSFIIHELILYNKKASSFLKGLKANISTRNFPQSISEIKRKFKIKDGGKTYLFFFIDYTNKMYILHCEKAP